MKTTRRILSWILTVLLVINPLVFEGVAWAAETQTPASTGTNTATDVNDQKAQEGAKTAQDASAQIQGNSYVSDSAKQQVQQASEQAQKDAAANAAANSGAAAGTMDQLSKAKSGVQKGLIKVGQILQKVGGILKTVGTALIGVGTALAAIPFTSAIGNALIAVGKVIYGVGTALEAVGKVLEQMGSDAAGLDANFSQNLTKVFTAAKEGYANGRKEADKVAADAKAKVDAGKQQIEKISGSDSGTGAGTGTEVTPQPQGATQAE